MSQKWVVVDVGCFECGEGTKIVSIDSSWEEAHCSLLKYYTMIISSQIKASTPKKIDDYFEYFSEGHHRVEIFEYF